MKNAKQKLPTLLLTLTMSACAHIDLNNPLLGEAGLLLGIVLNPRYAFDGIIKDKDGRVFADAALLFTINPLQSRVVSTTTVNSATTDSDGSFSSKLPAGSYKATVIQSNGFAESFNLTVQAGGKTSGSGVSVAYTPGSASALPTVTSFTPLAGGAADIVVVTGTNFAANSDGNSVYFNGVQTTTLAATSTSISVPVPTNATCWRVAVNNGAGFAVSNQIFNVVAPGFTDPIISDFTPYTAKAGSPVTIVGKNFDLTYTNNVVSFSGGERTASSSTGSIIDVLVPASAVNGRLILKIGSKSAISGQSFTLLPGGGDPNLSTCVVDTHSVGLCNVQ